MTGWTILIFTLTNTHADASLLSLSLSLNLPIFFVVGRSKTGVDFVLEKVDVSLLLLLFVLIDEIVSRYHLASPFERLLFEYFFFNGEDEDFDLREWKRGVDEALLEL